MKNTTGKNAYIGKQAKITESTIGASSIVEGVVENSSIGKGCYIDRNSRIIHSAIGDYSQVYNSELTCVNTGALFEAEDAKIVNSTIGQKNTVYGRIKNSFIGDGTKIHHSGAVIENSCIAPYRGYTVDIYNACVTHSVVWGGSDLSPGVNIRPNSIIGPFVHVGTGGETKAAFLCGGSALNKIEVAHRNYLGNFLACVIRIDAPINSKKYYNELQEKMEALLYGTILSRKVNQLIENPIQPEEELIIAYKGKEVNLTIEGINLGALFTTSNFDPRNDGLKGITIIKSGAKAGIGSGAQAPAVIETKALIGSMSKTFGRQTGTGDIVAGGSPETIRRGAIITQRGRLGDRTQDNIEINLDGLRQLEAFVNVSLAGLHSSICHHEQSEGSRSESSKRDSSSAPGGLRMTSHEDWEKLVYAKELEILKAQIEELAGWTLRMLELTEISVSNLKKDLKIGRGTARRAPTSVAQIKRRIREQSKVLAQANAIRTEIEGIKNRVGNCGLRVAHCRKTPNSALRTPNFRIHGTDGYRGNIHIEDKPVSYEDALNTALNEDRRLPEIFDLLAYSTIMALKLKGIDTENVLFGRDTRDLYTGIEGKEGRFTQAIIDGIRSAGSNVLDMGITPIPNASYMLAYLDYNGAPLKANVALVKTASHNPKHQDGLKVFYTAGKGKYIKLMPDDEELVTDIMFKTAIEGKKQTTLGKYRNNETTAVEVFSYQLSAISYQLEMIDTVILDLSNGAVSIPPYKQAIDELLKKCGIKNRYYVGIEPNGININEDDPAKGKVGAGHFEGADVIDIKETRGGKWGSFPVLEKLFKHGGDKASELKKTGKLIVAILTDGDGDRGYTMVYNPWERNVKLIDGDHALYLQLWNALENKRFANGETLAFTIESGTGFINSVTSLIKKYGFNVNLLETYDDKPSRDAINVVIAPVGDKYILFKQSLGSESTGHIIKKGFVLAEDGRTKNPVFAGNGVSCAIETLLSINNIILKSQIPNPKSQMHTVLNPYPHGNSHVTYCYFVDKQLWKRGNDIWKQAEAIINDSIKKAFARKRNAVIETKIFEREPDTLYMHVVSKDKAMVKSVIASKAKQSLQRDSSLPLRMTGSGGVNKFFLTLHVRPSGTEDKIGIKIFGDDDKETDKLSKEISEKMFSLLWQTMKNHTSKYAVREAEILRLLREKGSVTVGKLKKTFAGNLANSEAKRLAEIELAFLIDAMGMKKQGLVKTEGTGNHTLITLTQRGKKLLPKNPA